MAEVLILARTDLALDPRIYQRGDPVVVRPSTYALSGHVRG